MGQSQGRLGALGKLVSLMGNRLSLVEFAAAEDPRACGTAGAAPSVPGPEPGDLGVKAPPIVSHECSPRFRVMLFYPLREIYPHQRKIGREFCRMGIAILKTVLE